MSHSQRRDSTTDELLSNPSPSVRLVIPVVCFMESFSAFEDERKRHNKSIQALKDQVSQLKRKVGYTGIALLVNNLEKSIVELEAIFNNSQIRLNEAIEKLGASAEFIGLTPEILRGSLSRRIIGDPTDDLILESILDHAASRPSERKSFLSENRKDFDQKPYAKAALKAVGVKYFAHPAKFLEWHRSQSETID